MPAMTPVVDELHGFLRRSDPGGVVAVALFGSSAVGGLRPDSDLDVVTLTRRSLTQQDRRALVDYLLRVSGSRATRGPGRPIELTSLVLDDVVPWAYPATCDFLYGEWLRDDYLDGRLPKREVDSNLPVLITTAREHTIRLSGPDVGELLDPVPESDLFRSLHDGLTALLDNLVGDERNVLLTLARMIVTLETGQIVPKDEAAAHVLPSVPSADQSVLTLAAQAYRGETIDDWDLHRQGAADTAQHLADRIRR
jgi:aminoglycoside 9-adenylyltransferase